MTEIIYKKESYAIVGACFEVYASIRACRAVGRHGDRRLVIRGPQIRGPGK